MITPTIIVKANPRSTSPPKTNSAMALRSVVPAVITRLGVQPEAVAASVDKALASFPHATGAQLQIALNPTTRGLLQEAQNLRSVALAPWVLAPGLAVITSILAFNFLGDGLRDAADPYSR